MDKKTKILVWLAAFHAVLFVMAPILGVKVGLLFGFKFVVGATLFGFSYLITDIVNNNWGKAEARLVVASSVGARLSLYLIVMPLIVALPTFKAPPNYDQIMWGTFRLFVAGELATFLAQYFLEIPFFTKVRQYVSFAPAYVAGGVLNAAVGSLIFGLIAFWGKPDFSSMVVGQSVFAISIRFAALPLALGLNYAIKRLSHETVA